MHKNISSQSRISIREQNSIAHSNWGADWHPADVKAALKKRGLTLSALSRNHGYHPSAAGIAIRSGWPELERIIAEALGTTPRVMWPSRYTEDGVPLRYLPRRHGRPELTPTKAPSKMARDRA
jgi:Ner family transcriptional regulator